MGPGEVFGIILAIALIIFILIVIFRNIIIVPQAMSFVVERLGKYRKTWEAGLHLKIPIIERVAKRASLKEQVLDTPPQPVITAILEPGSVSMV